MSDTQVAASAQALLERQLRSKAVKNRKTKRTRASGSRLAPQAEFVLTSMPSNPNMEKCASVSCASGGGSKYAAFHTSTLSKYPQHPNALNSSSKNSRPS